MARHDIVWFRRVSHLEWVQPGAGFPRLHPGRPATSWGRPGWWHAGCLPSERTVQAPDTAGRGHPTGRSQSKPERGSEHRVWSLKVWCWKVTLRRVGGQSFETYHRLFVRRGFNLSAWNEQECQRAMHLLLWERTRGQRHQYWPLRSISFNTEISAFSIS